MLIKVTQSHIDLGCRGDGQACPVVASAIRAVSFLTAFPMNKS